MLRGRVIPAQGEPVDVEYDLWIRGLDDAGGSIRIDNDPVPGVRFMGQADSVSQGNLVCTLETESGMSVLIFFTNSDGTFVCQLADQAREALANN